MTTYYHPMPIEDAHSKEGNGSSAWWGWHDEQKGDKRQVNISWKAKSKLLWLKWSNVWSTMPLTVYQIASYVSKRCKAKREKERMWIYDSLGEHKENLMDLTNYSYSKWVRWRTAKLWRFGDSFQRGNPPEAYEVIALNRNTKTCWEELPNPKAAILWTTR